MRSRLLARSHRRVPDLPRGLAKSSRPIRYANHLVDANSDSAGDSCFARFANVENIQRTSTGQETRAVCRGQTEQRLHCGSFDQTTRSQPRQTAANAKTLRAPRRNNPVQAADSGLRVSMVSPFSTNACSQPRTLVQPWLWPLAASGYPANPEWWIFTRVPVPTFCGPRCCKP
jgi:hypothetical protein